MENTTAIANTEKKAIVPVSVAELKQQITVIQEAMRSVMKDQTHYGLVPGCGKKKVLLKPGAETILTLFRIGTDPKIEEITDGFDIRYRVIIRGFNIFDGNTIGYGVGEASTSEKKYKWRASVCHEEFEDTPETRRQIAYSKDYNGVISKVEQVRQNPADITNTVLKMAKKRALVDLCLTATACSDIFVQDIDDPDIADATGASSAESQPRNRYQPPRQRAAAQQQEQANPNCISDAQRKRLYAIGKGKNLTDSEMSFLVYNYAGVNRSEEIPRDKYDGVVSAFEQAISGQIINEE